MWVARALATTVWDTWKLNRGFDFPFIYSDLELEFYILCSYLHTDEQTHQPEGNSEWLRWGHVAEMNVKDKTTPFF